MRVASYYSNNDIRIEEIPVPTIGPRELLLKVEAAGICGTDVLEWYRKDRAPLVLGHEVAGTVADVGEGVDEYRVGDRIAAAHHVSCGNCHYCLSGHETVCETLRKTNFDPGGFAEYVRLPVPNVEKGVYRLPDELTFEEATFIEPLACVVRGQRLAGVSLGSAVLVVGSGISGLLHLKLALASGAARVVMVDVSDYKLEAARRMGATLALQAGEDIPEALRDVNDGRLADVVILCAGASSALQQALAGVERGGTVLLFAASAPEATIPGRVNDIFWRTEVSLLSSYAGSRADHLTALELIAAERVRVSDMITHRLGLRDVSQGFRLVSESKESIKVIIEPGRG